MKKLTILGLSVYFLLGIAITANSTTIAIYTNETAWENAVGSFLVEDFTDTTLNPGISFNSDWTQAKVDTTIGKWHDRVSTDDSDQTTIGFASGILAFGGVWDLAGPGGEGQGIQTEIVSMELTGSAPVATFVGRIDRATANTFWGFTSTDSFTRVVLSGGAQLGSAERYELDDMKYRPVTNLSPNHQLVYSSFSV